MSQTVSTIYLYSSVSAFFPSLRYSISFAILLPSLILQGLNVEQIFGFFFQIMGLALILLKWSKTMQDRRKVTAVTVPTIPSSPLCPDIALQKILQLVILHKDAPLFSHVARGN